MPQNFQQPVKAKADSMGMIQGYNYNNVYAPSTANFNDIYTNTLQLSEDSATTTIKDEDFYITGASLVEFHSEKFETSSSSSPSKHTRYSDYSNKVQINGKRESLPSHSAMTPSEVDVDSYVKVIPIKYKRMNYQRGVLDLLFPPTRVRTFKNVFDTVKKLLSHTFRK
ncbi:uncharacterized protein LOC131853923 [Achroia grisella]|uniref:uncharacterized protein LOC131853923 n=1 Tax=Achroia grisella TaxID=688607 RepID=UPI0027D30A98|nr:uncharacterized protein LOC131853923 [Achroia grisella]